MEYTAQYRGQGLQAEAPLTCGPEHFVGNELGFVCQVLQQYVSLLSPEKRPLFVICISQLLTEALKQPPLPTTSGEQQEWFRARQRPFDVGVTEDVPSPYEPPCLPEYPEPPTDNIAFRTIPCRNWIKFKGNCRLGAKCRFIHDPAFISLGAKEIEFPKSPTPHCWSFIQGTCKKTSQCKYYHPPPAHLRIYQRYTPCREWENCARLPACPFRHAPVIVGNVSDPSTTHPGFEEQPLVYRNEIQNAKYGDNLAFSTSTSHLGNGAYHASHHHPVAATSLDTIQEELGAAVAPTLPPGSSLASAGRRRSVGPSQLLCGVEDLETPLRDSSSMRPRGKSFDVAFMLPTKRDRAQHDFWRKAPVT